MGENANFMAPQIKAMPDTMHAAFEDFMEAFEAFKENNDRRLDEIDRKASADVITREKLERIDRALDDSKRHMDELALKKMRPQLGRHNGLTIEQQEHKTAFDAYIRRGDESHLREIELKAMSSGIAIDGGYLVPSVIDDDIGRRSTVISPMRSLATVRSISSNVLKKPFAVSGMMTGWVTETGTRTETSNGQFNELSIPTMELYAMPAATQSLLDDAAIDVEEWISTEIDIAFAQQEGSAFVIGDGVNKPKGLMDVTKIANASWQWDRIGYLATGRAADFAADEPLDVLIDTIYALKANYRQNATFLVNRKTQATLRKFKDGQGNYIWNPPVSHDQTASLMGFPVIEAEDMPDIGVDKYAIAFGDFRAGYLIVDRLGVRVLRDPFSKKPYVLFYASKRVGGGDQDFDAIKLIKFAVS